MRDDDIRFNYDLGGGGYMDMGGKSNLDMSAVKIIKCELYFSLPSQHIQIPRRILSHFCHLRHRPRALLKRSPCRHRPLRNSRIPERHHGLHHGLHGRSRLGPLQTHPPPARGKRRSPLRRRNSHNCQLRCPVFVPLYQGRTDEGEGED